MFLLTDAAGGAGANDADAPSVDFPCETRRWTPAALSSEPVTGALAGATPIPAKGAAGLRRRTGSLDADAESDDTTSDAYARQRAQNTPPRIGRSQ